MKKQERKLIKDLQTTGGSETDDWFINCLINDSRDGESDEADEEDEEEDSE